MTSLFRRDSTVVTPTPDQPGHSILLNGTKTSSSLQAQHVEDTASALDTSSTSSSSPYGSQQSLASQGRAVSSTSNTPSVAGSSKVSFAPLPFVPETKRRNSITLGVAARKDMLVQQGTAPRSQPGPPRSRGGSVGSGGVRKVYMTDEEWEEYKKKYDKKNGADAVDLGELASKGAKNLWRRVRSSSTSSTTSNSSSTSQSSVASPSSSDPNAGSSASPRTFFKARKRDASPASISSSLVSAPDELETVVEEDRHSPTLDMSSLNGALGLSGEKTFEGWVPGYSGKRDALGGVHDGDATPRRVRSPPPQVRSDSLDEESDDGEYERATGIDEPQREVEQRNTAATMPRIHRTASDVGQVSRGHGANTAILGFDSTGRGRA